jgi:hypothetical protein
MIDYEDYLDSEAWAARRERRLAQAGFRCEHMVDQWPERPDKTWTERCGETDGLEVHHLHYLTLGAEHDEDLKVLCRFHHRLTHVMQRVCARCEEDVFGCQEDAVHFLESIGGGDAGFRWEAIDLFAPEYCDYCQHVLDKDD